MQYKTMREKEADNGEKIFKFHSKVYLIQTLQALFYEQKTFWVTPKRTCLSVICSSVVGQLRWKEHIKKHKKFLIFLINKLDFISLRKIRNNDRTIEYISNFRNTII